MRLGQGHPDFVDRGSTDRRHLRVQVEGVCCCVPQLSRVELGQAGSANIIVKHHRICL